MDFQRLRGFDEEEEMSDEFKSFWHGLWTVTRCSGTFVVLSNLSTSGALEMVPTSTFTFNGFIALQTVKTIIY